MQRPSPSEPSKLFPGKTKKGNDGNKWQSRPNKNGIYVWRKVFGSKKTKTNTVNKKNQNQWTKEEENHWSLIKKINWKKDHNVNRVTKLLLKNPTSDELSTFVIERAEAIAKKFKNLKSFGHKFSSLMAEVVAEGKEFYENVDVKKLNDLFENRDLSVSFDDCFDFGD